MTTLVCRHCGNLVGRTDGAEVVISFKIRGQRRRSYRVPSVTALCCDYCEKEGVPISLDAFQAVREAEPPRKMNCLTAK